jgi:hypothetical protein
MLSIVSSHYYHILQCIGKNGALATGGVNISPGCDSLPSATPAGVLSLNPVSLQTLYI